MRRTETGPKAEKSSRISSGNLSLSAATGQRGIDVGLLLEALERSEPDLREQLIQTVAQPGVTVEEEKEAERDERRS